MSRTMSEFQIYASVLKPINHTGIVKFRGKLDPDKYDARIFVGVRMDDQGKLFLPRALFNPVNPCPAEPEYTLLLQTV